MWIEIKVKKITFRLSSVQIFDSLFSFLLFISLTKVCGVKQ